MLLRRSDLRCLLRTIYSLIWERYPVDKQLEKVRQFWRSAFYPSSYFHGLMCDLDQRTGDWDVFFNALRLKFEGLYAHGF